MSQTSANRREEIGRGVCNIIDKTFSKLKRNATDYCLLDQNTKQVVDINRSQAVEPQKAKLSFSTFVSEAQSISHTQQTSPMKDKSSDQKQDHGSSRIARF